MRLQNKEQCGFKQKKFLEIRMNIDNHWRKFLKDGDEGSFSIIYDHYVDKLFSYGIHLGFNEESCKDAIQDVFCKLYVAHKKLSHVENLTAYLFKSLRYRLIDFTRRDFRTDDLEQVSETFSIDVTILDNIIDEETTFLLKAKVENLLNSLSSQQREAVYMRYMLELEYSEIGDLLEIKPESVRKLVYRAIEKLREQIGENDSKALQTLCILLITNL